FRPLNGPALLVLDDAAERLAGVEPDGVSVGDLLAPLAPVVPLHGEAVAPDVHAEVLVGRSGRVDEVEPALLVGDAPVFGTEGHPDPNMGVRHRLAGLGRHAPEREDAPRGG